mgnify:CR=1 FL=1
MTTSRIPSLVIVVLALNAEHRLYSISTRIILFAGEGEKGVNNPIDLPLSLMLSSLRIRQAQKTVLPNHHPPAAKAGMCHLCYSRDLFSPACHHRLTTYATAASQSSPRRITTPPEQNATPR